MAKKKKSPKKTGKKSKSPKSRKQTIPKALREQVWIHYNGETFTTKCYVNWCENDVNVFDFHVGHDKPESKGGKLDIDNLRPICARCNLSMGNKYTIQQWNDFNKKDRCCFGWFRLCC